MYKYKFFIVVLLAIILLFLLNFKISAEEIITKVIGNDEYEFVIPDDYETLKSNYKKLINQYCNCENDNIDKTNIITEYNTLIDKLSNDIKKLEKDINDTETATTEYIKYTKKFKIYAGLDASFLASVDNDQYLLLSPDVFLINQNYLLGFGIPLHFSLNASDSLFDVGIKLTFGKKIN